MSETRKVIRSPRAPSIPLDEAIEKTVRIYEREHRHEAPTDVVAQNLGYKGARNGAALPETLASLRYYGLVDRPKEGHLAVSKDFETYNFAPDERMRRELLIKWLRTPTVFAELLDKFEGELPSDATLRFALIQKGFTPPAAAECLSVFRKSVEFARYYDRVAQADVQPEPSSAGVEDEAAAGQTPSIAQAPITNSSVRRHDNEPAAGADRIPIRLPGNRRAWLEIPSPFFTTDKARIKAQIDLLLTEDEEGPE